MDIIIIGCGKIGAYLAEQLNNEGHNITIVDKNEKLVNDIALDLDVIGVSGNGALLEVLREAGVQKAELLIATTGSDELNMLICLIAKQAGNIETIARIRDMEYDGEIDYLKKEFGLSGVINPEKMCATEIARILRFPSAISIESFSGGKAEMITMEIEKGSPLSGVLLKDLSKSSRNVLISVIERNGEALIPSGNSELLEGDVISFIAESKDAVAFAKKCDSRFMRPTSCFVIGAGRITKYLLKKCGSHFDFKLIDNNKENCEALSEQFPEATVICGDGTNQDLLREEGIMNSEVLLTLTGNDEQNVMISLIAKEYCKARRITKVNHMEVEYIPESLDLGSLACPKQITANEMLRFVRGKENSKGSDITSLYKIAGGKAEAQEYLVKNEERLMNIPLKELHLHPNVLIAAIIRKGRLIRPTGSDVILKDDHIVVMTLSANHIRSIQDILG